MILQLKMHSYADSLRKDYIRQLIEIVSLKTLLALGLLGKSLHS